jgi:antirestriction protein ArdC
MNRDVSQEVTAQIIDAIEKGGLSWVRGWQSQFPRSLATGKTYNGINALMLFLAQDVKRYTSPHWLTFNEARKRGGSVRKGEKATAIYYYETRKVTEKAADGTEQSRTFPLMRVYYVFNVAQCDGIANPDASTFSPIEAAERVANGYTVTLHTGGDSAHYSPLTDSVTIPHREAFKSPAAYYATLFHEYAHSTGAKHRLNRELSTKFASESYAYEELIAELASAFTCASVGIDGQQATQNNAAYVASWLKVLKGDKRAIFKAAKAAQDAHNWIMSNGTKDERTDAPAESMQELEVTA